MVVTFPLGWGLITTPPITKIVNITNDLDALFYNYVLKMV
jgi:hypothetical protein